jgi:hypothetical protein
MFDNNMRTWLMQAWQASGFLAISGETLVRAYGHHHPDFMHEAAVAIGRRSVRGMSA